MIRSPGVLRLAGDRQRGRCFAHRIPFRRTISVSQRAAASTARAAAGGAALLHAGGEGLALHVDGFNRQAGDYAIPGGGRQLNSGYRAEGSAVGASRIFDGGNFGLSYQRTLMTYYIPGVASAAERNHIDLWQSKWTSRGEWRIGEHGIDTLKYWFGATDYHHNEVDVVGTYNDIGSIFRIANWNPGWKSPICR